MWDGSRGPWHRSDVNMTLFTLAHWCVLWYLNMRETPILPKKLLTRLSSPSFWHTKNKNNQIIRNQHGKLVITNVTLHNRILPVSAKVPNGSDSLSLLSDSSAIAIRPLICSMWVGRWLDGQLDLKTSPIRLQSSCFAQSCKNKKAGVNTMTDWTQKHTNFGELYKSDWLRRTNLYFHNGMG